MSSSMAKVSPSGSEATISDKGDGGKEDTVELENPAVTSVRYLLAPAL